MSVPTECSVSDVHWRRSLACVSARCTFVLFFVLNHYSGGLFSFCEGVCVCVCASSLQERRVIILQFSHFSIYLQWLSLCNSDCIFVHGIWIYMIIYIYIYVCMKHECGLGFLFIVWLYSAMHLWSGVSVGCLKAEALLPVSRRISFHLQRGKWSQTEVWEALIGRLHPITARQRKLCCRAFSRAPPHSCVIPPLCDCFH